MPRDAVRLLRQSVVLTSALVLASCTDDTSPLQPSLQATYVTPTGLLTANPPQIFTGAGDISSCSNTGDEATAKLLDAIPEGTVFNLGDDAYNNGTDAEFACYHATWGRHKARTKPSAGNHEYNTAGATGYYKYFGAAAGDPTKGYYSYDLGLWHIIVLNSNITRNTGSPQDTWLAADLAAHPNQCTLAYFHHPLYSSTGGTGTGGVSTTSVRPFWDRLYAARADLVLNGHRHFYERLAPMKPDGSADPVNGIRTIIAGMGGIGGGSLTNLFPRHEVGEGSTFGVLKLYLYDDSYAWKFIPVAGKTFTDSGSTACHAAGGGGGGGGTVSGANSSLSANPTSFTVGSGSSTITATVRDGNNAAMSGVNVVFSATGSGNTFTPPSATTNSSGVATTTFTSSVAEAKTVSATAGGTLINQTASVTVNPSGGGGGGGTIAQTLLASGGDLTNQRVYTTAAISPAANALVTVAVLGRSSTIATPTITGGGMATWTQVASVDFNTIATPASRLVVFRAMSASPGSGAITITYASSQSNAQWLVSQWTGVDQTGTNGSGAIGQIGLPAQGNSVTTLSVPLAAFANANNVGFGLVGAAGTVTPGSGFTETGEGTSGESMVIEGEWGTNKNTITASWASSNAGMLGLEIKASGSGTPVVSPSNSTVQAAPGSITAGGSGSTITVTARDASNLPIAGATVVLSSTGSGNSFTAIGPTDGSGQATSTFTSTKAENKVISATINGVAINQQPPVTVTPAPDAVLAFTTQPSSTAASAPITPAVVVEVRDSYGNRTNSGASVAMDFGTNAGPGTLSGTIAQTAVNGMATFNDLAINTIANGYTLKASATGLTDAISNSFNITAPVPSAALSSVVAVTPSFTAGGSSDITVTVKDGLGNAMSGVAVTLSSTAVGDVVTQPAVTDGSGQTTGNIAATGAGQRTITAVAGGVTITQKPGLTVTAGPADAGMSTLTALPATITQTTGTSNITVTVRDQYGNPVNGATVALGATGAGNTLTGGGSTNSSGVATGTLTSTVAEVKIVSATADGTPITQTANVTVTPPSAGITHTLLTAGNDPANAGVYTTAAISPAANALVTIAVVGHRSTAAAGSPTVTGGGMSAWVEVATITFNTVGTPLKRMSIFRAMSASPGSGPITITFPATESNASWIVSQWTGINTTGTNGAGAIGQVLQSDRADGVTTISATLAPLGSPNNVAYGVVGTNGTAIGIDPGAGFAEISEQKPNESPNGILEALFGANQTVPSASWAGAFSAAILAVEIKTGP